MPEKITPYIIHYHHRISNNGNLFHCFYPETNKTIDLINKKLNLFNFDCEIFVDDCYREILNRYSDKDGLNYYSNQLLKGMITFEELKNLLKNSTEFKNMSNDISNADLDQLISSSIEPEILKNLVRLSRQYFGWFTKHYSRSLEYVWILHNIPIINSKKFLEIGSGINPLPIYLANNGGLIFTVDNHKTIRLLTENKLFWNEWGFLDYSKINSNIKSYNDDFDKINFDLNSIDYIYSVSSIEHIDSSSRKLFFSKCSDLLKKDGLLLLTVDMIPNSDLIWNYSEDKVVESTDIHGNLNSLKSELNDVGLRDLSVEILRKLPNSKTDIAMLLYSK